MPKKPTDFSELHRRVSWNGMMFAAPLPGIFFLLGYDLSAAIIMIVFFLFCTLDPLLRLLIFEYRLARQLIASVLGIYLLVAGFSYWIPVLALPFLVGALSLMLIWFSRKVGEFERNILGFKKRTES